jgi:diguanylate cyclase (GGDEF)-like protein
VSEPERLTHTPLRGPLARLERSREELAKSWLMRLIERASLDEISALPTERIAAELPALISDLLRAAAAGEDPFAPGGEAEERVAVLAELRKGGDPSAADLARDVAAIQSVVLASLGQDAGELGGAAFASLAASVTEAVARLQAAAVETLVDRRARELESQASTDPLTGLPNLRQLQAQLRHRLALVKRYDEPFALLVLDVDGLKRVNQGRGHQAGDRVLVQVGLALRRTIRAVDLPARLGGDEFCVLAPNQTADTARPLAERLAEAVAVETGAAEGDRGMGVAVGVVSSPEHGDEAEVLLDRADQAMYSAKAAGEPVALAQREVAGATRSGHTSGR